ncbi:MAG TPA: tetratricopeptide repeat protein [Polyangiales bacterium]|nr:tetratricopeptide repeat protein [Polyangiales bacterium]
MNSRLGVILLSALCLVLGACAGTAQEGAAHPALPRPLPAVVTNATYPDVLRGFQRLPAQAPERDALRERLAQHLVAKCDDAIGNDRYDSVVNCMAQIAELYSPAEYAAHAWPQGLERAARYLIAKGSPRGDEARVLSGLLVLKLLRENDADAATRYQKLVQWGFDARADMSGPLERFEGLVEAWEEHARLTPTPEVMATLVRLYIERRDALVKLFQSSDEQVPLSASVFQGVQRTALNVAAVFLREGDTSSALTQVKALGGSGGIEDKLIEILDHAREEGNEGAGALLDLSRAYLESGRPDVARALCLAGLRTRGDDARFPQCLARIAATTNDYGGALSWYADAIALVPDERALYDEILEVLNGLIEQGLFSSDPSSTRALESRATEILKERMRRWPGSAPPVAPEELYTAIGLSEMNAGNADEAEKLFKESLSARATSTTLVQLGLLHERTGHPREAADDYKKALDLVTGDNVDSARQRAELLERFGDAQRELGARDEAMKAYEKSLAIWNEIGGELRQKQASNGLLRRGVVLGRLGRAAEAKAAFTQAMDAAPNQRETYATILAYLAVSEPDAAFAHDVFRSARNLAGLPPEWKVYFALWLRMIAARAGQHADADVSDIFDDFAQGDGWWGKLARFGSGKIPFDKLVDEASGIGERTEAQFYEGARRLGVGDARGAREMFDKVLASQMVNFYEFAMAQELSSQLPASTPAAPAQAAR